MKPDKRWVIVVLVVVVIAILLWLWNPFAQEEGSPDGDAVQEVAAPEAPAAPAMPKVAEVAEPVMATVLFDFDRAVLRPAEAAKLDELSARFNDGAFERIEAIGHADRIGTDAYNLRLSAQRAEAVRGGFVGNGVGDGQILTEGRGESEPVASEACRDMGRENRKNRELIECLQPDRRVQITLVPMR